MLRERIREVGRKGFSIFTEEPIGDLEGDLCDWNKPSVFAHNYTPAEIEKIILKRWDNIIPNILSIIREALPEERRCEYNDTDYVRGKARGYNAYRQEMMELLGGKDE